jgi:hypothetical protein
MGDASWVDTLFFSVAKQVGWRNVPSHDVEEANMSNFKKLVEARMQKTGESWQTAEAQVRRRRQDPRATAPAPTPPGPAREYFLRCTICRAWGLDGAPHPLDGREAFERFVRSFGWIPDERPAYFYRVYCSRQHYEAEVERRPAQARYWSALSAIMDPRTADLPHAKRLALWRTYLGECAAQGIPSLQMPIAVRLDLRPASELSQADLDAAIRDTQQYVAALDAAGHRDSLDREFGARRIDALILESARRRPCASMQSAS